MVREAVIATIGIVLTKDNILSSNQRLNHFDKARRTRAIREMALVWARYERPAKMQAATLEVVVKWPPLKRTRDAANLADSVKAAVDGIVGDYGLLPGDDDRYLKKTSYSAAVEPTTLPGVAAHLSLIFTEVTP